MLKFKKGFPPESKDYIFCRKLPVVVRALEIKEEFEVETLEGVMKGKPKDFLMIGVHGEMYPIDREIFEKTYEIVAK